MILKNFSLKPFNTFGIDVTARYFAPFQTKEELTEFLYDSQLPTLHSPLILGGGSNILFTRDYDGRILKNEIAGIEVTGEDEEYIYIKAGAGENWHQFVLY
ncbi:MAG: UDP-N-acetylenolpyruvoylglucosamine reductase, partial [Bacteroidota bacterium]|nr:UDP-N-acetylenolpyruvoylglucosamine reductase [Bacteroidota bacterium]